MEFPKKPDDLLTVQELSEILKVSEDTVRRQFSNYPGVINLGTPSTRLKHRGYTVLRIPRAVLNKYLMERTI